MPTSVQIRCGVYNIGVGVFIDSIDFVCIYGICGFCVDQRTHCLLFEGCAAYILQEYRTPFDGALLLLNPVRPGPPLCVFA